MASKNPTGSRTEVRINKKNGRKEKVLIERTEPEGLPPGWIKELKVSRSGNKVRKDPYYTDPVSGYVFRSMKDVTRYLETGELGRLAFKPRERGSSVDEIESENDKDDSPSVKKQKIGDVELSSQDLKDSKKVDDGSNSDSTGCPSTPVSEITVTEKQTSENGEIGDEAKKAQSGSKSKKKKVMDLPRRSSKRLAGVALDPAPELQTNRARKLVANQSGDEPTSTIAEVVDVAVDPKPEVRTTRARKAVAKQQAGDERSNITVTLSPTPASETATGARCVAKQSSNTKQSSNKAVVSLAEGPKSTEVEQYSSMSNKRYGDSANLNKNSGKFEGKQECGKNQLFASALPSQDQPKTETGYEADSLDLPFGDLFSDPCIAFAIKTLTGDNFDASTGGNEASSIVPSSNNMFNIVDQSQNHLAIPVQSAGNNIIDNISKPEEKPGVPIESSFADIFTDPCIEFAIKTLTGSIPVVGDGALDYFSPPQQQNPPLPPQTQSTKTSARANSCHSSTISWRSLL